MLWAFRVHFLFGSVMALVSGNDQCRTEVNIGGMALKGFVLKRMSVSAPHICDIRCEQEITCQSYNYNRGENICELNYRTKDARPENFRPDSAWFYIRRLNRRAPLGSIPELPALSCQEIKASEGKDTVDVCDTRYWLDPSGTGKAVLMYCDMHSGACSFDFEDGIGTWKKTGTAFIYQPTFGDNTAARNRESAQQQGDWWIGGCEYRPNQSIPAGAQHPDGGDAPQGTLTSPCFRIAGKNISFLIGGGCDIRFIRVELIVNDQVVRRETGNCNETMYRKRWDVQDLIGQNARVRVVDESSGSWGHINFDDLKGDIICPHD